MGAAYGRGAVGGRLDFAASVWPLVEETPDVEVWAREFVEAGQATTTA